MSTTTRDIWYVTPEMVKQWNHTADRRAALPTATLPDLDPRGLLELIARLMGIDGDLNNITDLALRLLIKEAYSRLIMTDENIKKINKSMKKGGETVEKVGLDGVITGALKRTWKLIARVDLVVPFMVNAQKLKILVLVKEAGITDESKPQEIVRATMTAVRDLTF